MSTPLVSVIIPVYNCELFLSDALESVLAQTYKHLEVIVVDDGSTDSSSDIAQSYGEVHYISQLNQGVSVARNVGIAAACGEVVAFLDADDLWTPNKLDIQVDYLIKHPEIQYTITRIIFFLEKGYPPPSGFRRELLSGDHVGKIMGSLVARRNLFEIIGKFYPEYNTGEDTDWFARANDANIPMATIPEVLLYKRVHDINLSIISSETNRNLLKILRKSIERKREKNKEKE